MTIMVLEETGCEKNYLTRNNKRFKAEEAERAVTGWTADIRREGVPGPCQETQTSGRHKTKGHMECTMKAEFTLNDIMSTAKENTQCFELNGIDGVFQNNASLHMRGTISLNFNQSALKQAGGTQKISIYMVGSVCIHVYMHVCRWIEQTSRPDRCLHRATTIITHLRLLDLTNTQSTHTDGKKALFTLQWG